MASRFLALGALLAAAGCAAGPGAAGPGDAAPPTPSAPDAARTFDLGVEPPATPIVLEDETVAAGLPSAGNPCLAFRDFDGDERPDLLLAPYGDKAYFGGALVLYRNRGDGTFEPHATPIPLHFVGSCAVADLDGDGALDVVVSGGSDEVPVLLTGKPGGLDFQVSALTVVGAGTSGLDLADFDGDGRPDLLARRFVDPSDDLLIKACAVDPDGTVRCTLSVPLVVPASNWFRNTGTGFAPWPIALARDHLVNLVAFIDWDGDGRLDLLETGDFGSNLLYRNDGGGAVTELLAGLGAAPYNHGMGAAIGDFDRDGRWDVYLVELGADYFYFGTDGGGLEDRSAPLGIKEATRLHSAYGPSAADLNNDGWLDLFIPNAGLLSNEQEVLQMVMMGLPMTARPQADFVLTSHGGRRFEVSELPHRGGTPSFVSAATAVADYDGDGRLDIAEVLFTEEPELHLYRNRSAGGHYLEVRLRGKAGGALQGAVVEVRTADGADRRAVGVGGSGGVSDEVLHFGLGARTVADRIAVRFPDGMRRDLPGPIAADRIIEIAE